MATGSTTSKREIIFLLEDGKDPVVLVNGSPEDKELLNSTRFFFVMRELDVPDTVLELEAIENKILPSGKEINVGDSGR